MYKSKDPVFLSNKQTTMTTNQYSLTPNSPFGKALVALEWAPFYPSHLVDQQTFQGLGLHLLALPALTDSLLKDVLAYARYLGRKQGLSIVVLDDDQNFNPDFWS